VYANEATAVFIDDVHGIECFRNGEPFALGDLAVAAFSVVHDAADPVGFVITSEGLRFGQATDLGRVTPLVRDSLSLCNSVVIESNHDQELLLACEYPWELKQRIASSHGHLSNDAAAELLADVLHPDLFHVVLGHISENSNTPSHALRAAKRVLGVLRPRTLECADIYRPTQLLDVTDDAPLVDVAMG
jgi:phosphoribosyl 1,2-cyclic phosphodiesterase